MKFVACCPGDLGRGYISLQELGRGVGDGEGAHKRVLGVGGRLGESIRCRE